MQDVRALNELVAKESAFVDDLLAEVGKVIVGQTYMIERILIGLLTGGHVLLEGVPGLAKTLTVRTLCDAIHAKFARVQFTPDLLPADLIGTVIYNQKTGEFTSKLGPIFANLVLADEINRAPAKVQSALLEAMQERQVTIGDKSYPLPDPFIVMATQNPIEQEGTYPLPEAQVDRFMLMVKVGYPIARRRAHDHGPHDRCRRTPQRAPRRRPTQLLEARKVVRDVYVDDRVKDYIVDVVFATREPPEEGHEGSRAAHRVRRQPARQHRAQPGGARARLPAPPRLRHAGGREGDRPRRAPPPPRPQLRGRGRRGDRRGHRAPRVRGRRSALSARAFSCPWALR